jgi:hypothetical protein
MAASAIVANHPDFPQSCIGEGAWLANAYEIDLVYCLRKGGGGRAGFTGCGVVGLGVPSGGPERGLSIDPNAGTVAVALRRDDGAGQGRLQQTLRTLPFREWQRQWPRAEDYSRD